MRLQGILVITNAVERLKIGQLLTKIKNVSLKEEFDSAIDASEYLTYNAVDFIVLKADLPVYDAFDFLKSLKNKVEVILISKQDQDALIAFELGLVDCLPSNFKKERLQLSFDRIRAKHQELEGVEVTQDPSIVIRCNLKNEKIFIKNILWIEAMGDYIRIITSSKKYVILSTMKQFMNRLPPNQFFRTHKSFIVNVKKVDRYTANEVEVAGKLLPLSRSRKGEFQSTFSLN